MGAGNELDGLHWLFGMLWVFFMLWCAWFGYLLSEKIKEVKEREDEIQRMREAAQLSERHTSLPETSKRPDAVALPSEGS